jgi:hypothetical protein
MLAAPSSSYAIMRQRVKVVSLRAKFIVRMHWRSDEIFQNNAAVLIAIKRTLTLRIGREIRHSVDPTRSSRQCNVVNIDEAERTHLSDDVVEP